MIAQTPDCSAFYMRCHALRRSTLFSRGLLCQRYLVSERYETYIQPQPLLYQRKMLFVGSSFYEWSSNQSADNERTENSTRIRGV